MKRRVIAMLLATSMVSSALAGCGAKNEAQANGDAAAQANEQSEAAAEDTAASDTSEE